jgi:enoyl-CoA hydratase/carnithine racemase
MIAYFGRFACRTALFIRKFSSETPICMLKMPQPGIALLQLNKPESKNALSRAMLEQFSSALATVRQDHTLRAAVIWGGSTCFCAGADLVERRSMDDAQVRRQAAQFSPHFYADLAIFCMAQHRMAGCGVCAAAAVSIH